MVLGHLNYLSSVFVGILFGLGIDFGIYFIRRFDEERMGGLAPAEAVHRTLTTVGQGIVTGGLTAVVSFLALGVTDQPAFAELGIVAGMGVGMVLVATLFLLPPLLVRFPPRLKGVRSEISSSLLEGSARLVLRRPGIVTGLFSAVGSRIGFSPTSDRFRLQPEQPTSCGKRNASGSARHGEAFSLHRSVHRHHRR